MKTITEKPELISNIRTFENYLIEGIPSEQKVVRDLIRNGICLVAYKVDDEINFAPSRFLGYKDNDIVKHLEFDKKHGTLTNQAIDKTLKLKHSSNPILEEKYLEYCNSLFIKPANRKNRKYWFVELEIDFEKNKELDVKLPEGKIAERIHKSRERNPKVISVAKSNFKLEHGNLLCQCCGFDFEKKYGEIGADFIEGHHTIPVSEMKENHMTSPNDIVLLCANCHRMIHKKKPWLSIDELKLLIK